MGLFNKLFGDKKSENDEPFDKQKADLLKFTKSSGVNNNGCDQIPGAYGSFGTTPTNPIPVNGIIGETVYLFRLRSKTGTGFYYHRLGHIFSSPSKNPIDHYELVAADASEWCDLFFDCYYPRRSTKTPDGLTSLSWNSLDDQLKMMAKLPMCGVNIEINNFPYGLPDAIESNQILNDISPDIGSAVAEKIRINLNKYKGQWERETPRFKTQTVNKATVQIHLAEYLAFLMQFFTDFEDIQRTFGLKNEPNNLNGLIDFAFFLDMVTNLPDIFKEYKTIDMDDVIYRFILNTVNAVLGLSEDFGEKQICQATERVKLYSQLLNDDLNNHDTCNYQSICAFLKEVFSGKITEEEKTVIINILRRELSAIESLIMMKSTSSSVKNIKNIDHDECDIVYSKPDALFFFIDGIIYERDEKYDDAIINYKKVTELYPESAAAYYKLGKIYRTRHEMNQAISSYTRVIEIESDNFFAYYYRGISYYTDKKLDQALSDFNKAITILPTIEKSFLKQGFINLWSFDFDYSPLNKLLTTITSEEEKVLRLSLGIKSFLVYAEDDKSFSTHFKTLEEKIFHFDEKKYSDALSFYRLACIAKISSS